MKNWTEYNISIIYFGGLFVAIGTSILAVLYLRPIKPIITKITGKFDSLWNHSFKTTFFISGLLGAMSVSFTDCYGKYDYLLKSRYETIKKGFEQVSSSFDYLTIILGLWLIIFIVLRLISIKKNKMPST